MILNKKTMILILMFMGLLIITLGHIFLSIKLENFKTKKQFAPKSNEKNVKYIFHKAALDCLLNHNLSLEHKIQFLNKVAYIRYLKKDLLDVNQESRRCKVSSELRQYIINNFSYTRDLSNLYQKNCYMDKNDNVFFIDNIMFLMLKNFTDEHKNSAIASEDFLKRSLFNLFVMTLYNSLVKSNRECLQCYIQNNFPVIENYDVNIRCFTGGCLITPGYPKNFVDNEERFTNIFKYIVHTVVPNYNEDENMEVYEQAFKTAYLNTLYTAHSLLKVDYIILPLILVDSDFNLYTKHAKLIQKILQEYNNFCVKNKEQKMNIIFSILHPNQETIFENYMTAYASTVKDD